MLARAPIRPLPCGFDAAAPTLEGPSSREGRAPPRAAGSRAPRRERQPPRAAKRLLGRSGRDPPPGLATPAPQEALRRAVTVAPARGQALATRPALRRRPSSAAWARPPSSRRSPSTTTSASGSRPCTPPLTTSRGCGRRSKRGAPTWAPLDAAACWPGAVSMRYDD